jgi:hypothetical protein
LCLPALEARAEVGKRILRGGRRDDPHARLEERKADARRVLASRQARGAIARLGNTIERHGMGAQKVREVRAGAQAGGLLQALEEAGHGVRVVARGDERLHADAVGFLLVGPREVDLRLQGAGLHRGDGGSPSLGVVRPENDRAQHRGQGRHR